MRGSLVHRGPSRWALVLDRGYVVNPATGLRKRKQQWISFQGTKQEAGNKLTELVRAHNRGEFVEPSKTTVAEWLQQEWLTKVVEPTRRPATTRIYRLLTDRHIVPALGALRLQALKPADIQEAYATIASKVAPATASLIHSILSTALQAALQNGLVTRNVARLVSTKPRKPKPHDGIVKNTWTATEAARFLSIAKEETPLVAAFYSVALSTGARRSELAALKWSDVDLDGGRLRIMRQLDAVDPDGAPVFGPPKNKQPRTVDLDAATIALIKAHKRSQAEVKMKNRTAYQDHDLVFAMEWPHVTTSQDQVGMPLRMGQVTREFCRLIKAADVKRISLHGLRHTSASLMVAAGVPVKVVAERLGHANVMMTLSVYSHVLPGMQKTAADQLAALLHG